MEHTGVYLWLLTSWIKGSKWVERETFLLVQRQSGDRLTAVTRFIAFKLSLDDLHSTCFLQKLEQGKSCDNVSFYSLLVSSYVTSTPQRVFKCLSFARFMPCVYKSKKNVFLLTETPHFSLKTLWFHYFLVMKTLLELLTQTPTFAVWSGLLQHVTSHVFRPPWTSHVLDWTTVHLTGARSRLLAVYTTRAWPVCMNDHVFSDYF